LQLFILKVKHKFESLAKFRCFIAKIANIFRLF